MDGDFTEEEEKSVLEFPLNHSGFALLLLVDKRDEEEEEAEETEEEEEEGARDRWTGICWYWA
jgi:hypothetical protein